jgi:hypothetical protein
MSKLFDDASLAMIPSAYKDGKLYSITPSDGSGDFTFSRGTSATRVNASGLIEKERSNQLLQSNAFNTTWVNVATTDTSGQSGYDGSSDAWLLTNTAANGRIEQSITKGLSVYTLSIYAKGGTAATIRLRAQGATNNSSDFLLSDGSNTANSGNVISATSSSVGGGWYRFEMAFNDSISKVYFYPLGADTENIYIQDAQLEQGLVATDYIETTTAAVYEGITDNLPRLDYSGGASCPSLLLEPSRTNYFDSSEYLKTINSNLTQSVSDVNSPISGLPYLKILKSNSGVSRILQNRSVSGVYTYSVFAKQGSTNGNIVSFADSYFGTSTLDVSFNLSTGSFVGTPSGNGLIDSDFEDFGNGSYRIWVAFNHDTASTGTEVRSPSIFLDNGQLNVNEYIYLTGFQFEAGSYPTSYIPTYGTAVSRANESSAFELSVLDFFSLDTSESGTFFIETKYIKPSSQNFVDMFSQGGSGNNTWRSTNFQVRSTSGSSNEFQVQDINTVNDDYIKIIIRKDGTTYNVFINGVKSSTTRTITSPLQWFEHIGLFRNSQMIKQMIEFSTALTDAECIALTSL